MKKNYNDLMGKTKEVVLSLMGDDQFNDPHSDKWIFYMDKDYFWRKRYLYLFFERGIVVRTSIVFKNFWEKG